MDERHKVQEAVQRFIVESLGLERMEDLTEETDLFESGLNSINVIALMLTLESHFKFTFEMNDVKLADFRTIAAITRLVCEKIPA